MQTPAAPALTHIYRGWVLAIAIIVFLSGVTLFLLGRHYESSAMAELGGFILLVVTLHFLHEQFIRRAERAAMLEQIINRIQPQQAVLQQLDAKLCGLEQKFDTSFSIVRFTDGGYFNKHWQAVVAKYDHLAMIGDYPPELWLSTIDKLGGRKQLSIYTTASRSNKSHLKKLIEKQAQQPDRLQIRHIERTHVAVIALGWTRNESSAEVLLNHTAPNFTNETSAEDHSWSGHHLIGATALEVYKSLIPRLGDRSFHDIDRSFHDRDRLTSIRIFDNELLDFLWDKHAAYLGELNLLTRGVPVRGREAICDRMSKALDSTKKSVVITHITKTSGQVGILSDKSFRHWLQVNTQAAQRGVRIVRIFLITRELLHHENAMAVAQEMRRHNMEVRFFPWEDLYDGWRYDFSVYDDERVIYISTQPGGGWVKDDVRKDEEEARTATDPEIVEHFSSMFREIERGSKPFPLPRSRESDPDETLSQPV